MEIDGQLIIESADIMAALEEEFPERPMLPAEGTPQRQRADNLMRLERRLFSDCCSGCAPPGARLYYFIIGLY